MKKILLSLGNVDGFLNGIELITNAYNNGEYPMNVKQLEEWAINFHPHLPDFKKLLCNFEADIVTSVLRKVYEQHTSSNNRIAMYEMFG